LTHQRGIVVSIIMSHLSISQLEGWHRLWRCTIVVVTFRPIIKAWWVTVLGARKVRVSSC
jgi:hypothetical protein